jgi:hypothetical protein
LSHRLDDPIARDPGNGLPPRVFTYEESKQMPYVTTVERAGIEKGHRIGYQKGEADLLLWLIEDKFGADSAEALRERIESADNDSLRRWSVRILS